jgi:hypothetical protein
VAEHTVFVLGAGASLAEATARRPVQEAEHPPLDANFFERVAKYRPDEYTDQSGASLFQRIRSGARVLGEPDLGTTPGVSLEEYLGQLYFSVQNNPLKASVRDYFTLVDLYSREVIRTTEWMVGKRASRRENELLRRMLQRELSVGNALSIITFNIDLLIESTLAILCSSRPGAPWTIEDAYGFSKPLPLLFGSGDTFRRDGVASAEIKTYKLHGSVNWLFQTRDYFPPADLMTHPRTIKLLVEKRLGTRRLRAMPKKKGRKWPLFPLIVPPVYEKHLLIRNNLSEVWSNAEAALLAADRVVFWGYSFPQADMHARHFFKALSVQNAALKSPVLINPDPASAVALGAVLRPTRVEHYRDAAAYLS